jgi:hypothetical protein
LSLLLKEMILIAGGAGTGKSYNAMSLIQNIPATFWVLDSDGSYAVMTMGDPPPNVKIFSNRSWEETRAYGNAIKQAGPDDWLVIDMLDVTWDHVRRYYISQVFGQDMGEYFLQARMRMKGNEKRLEALRGWIDWDPINRLYADWWEDVMAVGCNIYATTKAKEPSASDEAEVQVLSAPHGVKPAGQKHVPHRFHTVLLSGVERDLMSISEKNPCGLRWYLTTWRERWPNRRWLRNYVISDFYLEYMIGIAGWSPPRWST